MATGDSVSQELPELTPEEEAELQRIKDAQYTELLRVEREYIDKVEAINLEFSLQVDKVFRQIAQERIRRVSEVQS